MHTSPISRLGEFITVNLERVSDTVGNRETEVDRGGERERANWPNCRTYLKRKDGGTVSRKDYYAYPTAYESRFYEMASDPFYQPCGFSI